MGNKMELWSKSTSLPDNEDPSLTMGRWDADSTKWQSGC